MNELNYCKYIWILNLEKKYIITFECVAVLHILPLTCLPLGTNSVFNYKQRQVMKIRRKLKLTARYKLYCKFLFAKELNKTTLFN